MSVPLYTLMLVTNRDTSSISQYLKFIERCAKAGISSVQLREKKSNFAVKLSFAQQLKELLDPLHIPLIINDDLDLALKINASGLHLGQSDGDVIKAREKLGPDKYLGLSIETKAQLELANQYPLDYIAASAVFPTVHKKNVKKLWGLAGLSELSLQSKHPVIGIGGITCNNIQSVILAGAKGAAIIGAIHEATDPVITVKQFRSRMV